MIRVVLAISLALNALAFAVYLERTSRRTERPDVYRMDRTDQLSQLPGADVVLLGDSLTDRGEWHELLGRRIANRGIAGDTIAGATARLAAILAARPRTIAIMLGINDLLAGEPVPACAARYAALLDAIRRADPTVRIIVQTVLPVARELDLDVRAFNAHLRTLCAARGCELLDLTGAFDTTLDPALTTDGVHLNGRGYARWASLLRPVLDHAGPIARDP